jgi:hypothetical protein
MPKILKIGSHIKITLFKIQVLVKDQRKRHFRARFWKFFNLIYQFYSSGY